MLYSKRHNLLFVAAPKTGSTSVEETLEKLCEDGERFKIKLDCGRVITSEDVSSPSLGHARARELRAALGTDRFDDLHVFGFVRDPIEKIVSSFFFTRAIKLRNALSMKAERGRRRKVATQVCAILVSRILPLWAWSLLYPMRDCHSYFCDLQGQIIVDFLGSTSRMSEDLEEILKLTGADINAGSVRHTNKSSHKKPEEYWFFRFFIPLLKRRYSRDCALAELVSGGIWKNPEKPQ